MCSTCDNFLSRRVLFLYLLSWRNRRGARGGGVVPLNSSLTSPVGSELLSTVPLPRSQCPCDLVFVELLVEKRLHVSHRLHAYLQLVDSLAKGGEPRDGTKRIPLRGDPQPGL